MKKILEKIVAFTQTRYMRILTNGFLSIAAVSVAGSLFTLVKSIPLGFWQNFLTTSGLGEILSIPISCTTDLIAVYVCLSMANQVAKEFGKDPFSTAIVALGAFFLVVPFTGKVYSADYSQSLIATGIIPTASTGARAVFVGIFAGIVAARLYCFFVDKGWTIKMPDSVPDIISKMFEMMIPGGLVFLIFLAIRYGFSLTSYGTMQSFVYAILQKPFVSIGSGVVALLLYNSLGWVFFGFGIHGGMVMYTALIAVIPVVNAANTAAFAAGQAAPYQIWGWANFLADCNVLPLTIVMLLFAKSKQNRTIAKISVPTSIFNISEPLIYGIPCVMNPIMITPFFLTALVNTLLTVLVTSVGIVAPATGASFSMNIPSPILGALINSHWTGFVWGIVIWLIDMAIYYPFFRVWDKKAVETEMANEAETAA
ncbi:MAG: PTS transporter subunit EIIC [Erysipelotrichaceae bacterium]|nr:PTS transporter subunit EIIC [Erysipelotrichaceae bacterium]